MALASGKSAGNGMKTQRTGEGCGVTAQDVRMLYPWSDDGTFLTAVYFDGSILLLFIK